MPVPESTTRATWFRITSRHQLFRGAHGITRAESAALSAVQALQWILNELPEEAVSTQYDPKTQTSVITVRWNDVPLSIRDPQIPERSRG
jgi:hypothetical protein